jgi:hypothetical protein
MGLLAGVGGRDGRVAMLALIIQKSAVVSAMRVCRNSL